MGTSHGVDRHAHNMIEINETFPLSLPLIPFDLHDPNLNIFHTIWTNSFLRGRKRIPIDPQDLQYCILMNFTFGKRWDVWVQPTFLEAHAGHSRSSLRTSLFSAIVWGKFNGPTQEEPFWGRAIYRWRCLFGTNDSIPVQNLDQRISKPIKPWLFQYFFCKTTLVFPSFLMFFDVSADFSNQNPWWTLHDLAQKPRSSEDLPPLLHGAGQEAGRRASRGSPAARDIIGISDIIKIYLGYYPPVN